MTILTQPQRKAIFHFDGECKAFFKNAITFLHKQGLDEKQIWREMPKQLTPAQVAKIIGEIKE